MRMNPEDRKEHIVLSAAALAEEISLEALTLQRVADEAEISRALISHYFGSIVDLRDEVMTYAVLYRVLPLVAQGLIRKNSIALKASRKLKYEATAWLADEVESDD